MELSFSTCRMGQQNQPALPPRLVPKGPGGNDEIQSLGFEEMLLFSHEEWPWALVMTVHQWGRSTGNRVWPPPCPDRDTEARSEARTGPRVTGSWWRSRAGSSSSCTSVPPLPAPCDSGVTESPTAGGVLGAGHPTSMSGT